MTLCYWLMPKNAPAEQLLEEGFWSHVLNHQNKSFDEESEPDAGTEGGSAMAVTTAMCKGLETL